MKIHTYQKSQAENTQILPFAFGVSSLRQVTFCLGIDKGIEVCGVEQECSQINLKIFDQTACEFFFDGGDGFFIHIAHMVPEALRRQGAFGCRHNAMENGFAVPVVEARFAGSCHTPIQGSEEDVVTA